MPTPQFIQEFRIKYTVALIMVVLELFVAQAIIQRSLFDERMFRAASITLDVQRARELYYADAVKSIAIDPVHRLEYIKQISVSHSIERWQHDEATLYSNDAVWANPAIQADFAAAKQHYEMLKWAYRSILQTDSGASPVDIRPQLLTIIAHDTAYVTSLYDAYKRLNMDADNVVIRVQWYELGLFLLALLTLLYESVCVIRPALHQLRADLANTWQTPQPQGANE